MMTITSKIAKTGLEISQFTFGAIGGILFIVVSILSQLVTPLKKLILAFKSGAPIYSTMLMTIVAVSFLLLVAFAIIELQTSAPIQERLIGYLLVFLVFNCWGFLCLDLFAYYRRYRKDRKL